MTGKEVPNSWEMEVVWPASGRQRVYDLSQALEPGIPHHPAHPPYAFALTKKHGEVMYQGGVTAAAELLTLGGHVGTHVDGLCHVARDGKIHGDHDITGDQSYTHGMGTGAIERVAPFMGPGFLVDGPRLFGRELTRDDAITADHLAQWFADRPGPAPGSVVLVRTGWDTRWKDNRDYLGVGEGTPGVDLSGAKWLTERKVRATGADTIAYEKLPSHDLVVHVHLLVDSGVHIIEALNLADLSADGIEEFFFLAVPLRIRGGTGSPIRPLAVVAGGEG